MHAAARGPARQHAGVGGRHYAVGEAHAPRKQRGLAVVAIAGEQAADASNGVTDGGGRCADIKEFENRSLEVSRQQDQREESAKKSAEPGKPVAREQHGPGIGEEFRGRFEYVVEARAD